MLKRSIEERLAQLEAQRQTLKARLGKQERAKDTRRKILLGALVAERLKKDKTEFDKTLNEWLQRELPGFLTREEDKALFADLLIAPLKTSAQERMSAQVPMPSPAAAHETAPEAGGG